jgi:hypothetical protein
MKRLVVCTSIAVSILAGCAAAAPSAAPTLGTASTPAPVATQPTAASQDPTLLARGHFNVGVGGRPVELDAAAAGSSVMGSMATGDGTEDFNVDLQCTRTTEDGLIWIGGDVTESTTDFAPAGTWAGIVIQRGSPIQAAFVFQLDDPRMATCPAFLEQMIAFGSPSDALEPIEGTVELRP